MAVFGAFNNPAADIANFFKMALEGKFRGCFKQVLFCFGKHPSVDDLTEKDRAFLSALGQKEMFRPKDFELDRNPDEYRPKSKDPATASTYTKPGQSPDTKPRQSNATAASTYRPGQRKVTTASTYTKPRQRKVTTASTYTKPRQSNVTPASPDTTPRQVTPASPDNKPGQVATASTDTKPGQRKARLNASPDSPRLKLKGHVQRRKKLGAESEGHESAVTVPRASEVLCQSVQVCQFALFKAGAPLPSELENSGLIFWGPLSDQGLCVF